MLDLCGHGITCPQVAHEGANVGMHGRGSPRSLGAKGEKGAPYLAYCLSIYCGPKDASGPFRPLKMLRDILTASFSPRSAVHSLTSVVVSGSCKFHFT